MILFPIMILKIFSALMAEKHKKASLKAPKIGSLKDLKTGPVRMIKSGPHD